MTCGLKVNGCNCEEKLAKIRNTKDACFLSYVEARSKDQ
jgi:hypothetical protein